MSFDYGSIVNVAVSQIADKGRSVILNRFTSGTYNPSTGTVSGASRSSETVSAVVTDYKDNQIDGGAIKRGDKMLIISADQSPASLQDSFEIDGDEYQIVNIESVSPSGVDIIYKIQVRR